MGANYSDVGEEAVADFGIPPDEEPPQAGNQTVDALPRNNTIRGVKLSQVKSGQDAKVRPGGVMRKADWRLSVEAL